ncbi:DUF5710 domain-containing protein [Labrenzia sp. 011]|uniref:DUF5710 domain-containing protein n=1 Tax=Labrenzia sp. 011 TaxID=2171494 RepID=UPI000D510A3B|nr:DUF5710 domain-containing protein [Labrenzia sp. 011]PVB60372.1 hypothetical protein DCO57_17260 [Labrenzia sp. 011]
MADKQPIQKTYLAVPYEQRQIADEAGALWDKKAKAWFVKGTEVPDTLKQFLPENQQEQPREDPRTAFANFLRDNGAKLQGLPEMDGKWHRIALAGDGKETNASYRGFLDGVPNGQFKNFKGDEVPLQWISKGDGLTQQEKHRLVAEAAQNREDRERERAKEQETTAKRAFGIWTNLKSWATPDNCPYLARKTVRGYGVKVADDGRMVVPLRDENGRIWSLQFVGDDKIYLKNGRKDGLFHTIDPGKDLESGRDKGDKLTIVIGEGYATGADVHKATNLPTAIAFDGDNLVATAKAVREKFPKANLLIAADDDHHLPNRNPPLPNKGLKCAQRAAEAVGGKVLAPSFTPAEKERGATDWNDLKQFRGEKGLLTALRDSFVQMQREQARGLGKEKGLGRELERSR